MRTTPPSLPNASGEYDKTYHDRLNRVLTLFFNELVAIGPLEGTSLRLTGLPPSSTIQHPVNTTDTVFTLHDASLFPLSGFGTVGTERFSWSGKSGNSLTGILRGQLGTTATTHPGNALVVAAVEPGTVYAGLDKLLRVL